MSSSRTRRLFDEAGPFSPGSVRAFTAWVSTDPVLFERLTRLIGEAARDPFGGIGKPEPLKHQLKGYWSRRINAEHWLVYKATTEAIIIVSCRYHY